MNTSGQDSGEGDNFSKEVKPSSGVYEPERVLKKNSGAQSKYVRWASGGGKVQKWVVGKPKYAGKLPEDPTSPRVERLNVPAVVMRLVLLAVGTSLVVGFAMWVVLGLTVLPTAQVGDNYYLTNRTAWTEGAAPNGVSAVVLGKPVERSIYSRLVMLFNSDPDGANSLVKIVGRDTAGNYLAVCEAGACEKQYPAGTVFSAPIGNVLGQASAKMWFVGIEKIAEPN